jgi:cobalt-precorrin-5B (C1)-methyltransferase
MIIETLKRFGITTGAAASAASKAASLALLGNKVSSVTIPTPLGIRIEIPVEEVNIMGGEACAKVRKFSGDNPDILNGVEIISCVKLTNETDIEVQGGEGIGVITRPGLKVGVGKKAINPIPLKMIKDALREVIKEGGAKVRIEVPKGVELSKMTMNKDVGIVDGISILGTTGIETPVSDEDYLDHINCELKVIRANSDKVVISPGNTGSLYSSRIYPNIVVKVGDRVGDSISLALKMGFRNVICAGLPGKLVKLSVGIFNTHNKYGDARIEAITHACVVKGVPMDIVNSVSKSLTVEEATKYLGKYKVEVFDYIAEKILEKMKRLGNADFGVIIFNYNGEVISRRGYT